MVHQLWIKPIWFIAPAGLAIAIAGGLAIGWSYFHLRSGLPAGPWRTPAVFGVVTALLAPGMLLSFTHGPLFDLATAKVVAGQGTVAMRFALELLLPACLGGALAGWWLGRSLSAAIATALAGLAFALGPGHNIPMFGTNPLAFKGHAIVLIIVVSSIVLVQSDALVSRLVAPQR